MKILSPLAAFALAAIPALAADDYTLYPEDRDLSAPLPDGVYHSPALPPSEGEPIRKYAEDEPGDGAENFGVQAIHDDRLKYYFLADRAEYRWNNDGGETALWDVQGFIGDDYNKLWLESEGEWARGEGLESAYLETMYARSISSFWYLRAGMRQDFRPEPLRTSGVLSLAGLSPYFFDNELNLYVDTEGRVWFNLEVEFDIRLTQHLVLQPRFETDLAVQSAPEYGLGSGFQSFELGLRLRYEITRKFAPYIGISWETAAGETADMRRSEGSSVGSVSLVTGIRFWF